MAVNEYTALPSSSRLDAALLVAARLIGTAAEQTRLIRHTFTTNLTQQTGYCYHVARLISVYQ